MGNKNNTAFIPSLLLGFGIALSCNARPVQAASVVIDTFEVTSLQGNAYVPLVYYAGSRDRPDPGYYHQAILLQKSTETYYESTSFDFEAEESEVFRFKDDFQY